MQKSKRKSVTLQSRKHPDCPLTRRSDGRFQKKVRGVVFYFGKDEETAIQQWLDQKDDILAGRGQRSTNEAGVYSVGRLINEYLTKKQNDLDIGKITARHFADLSATAKRTGASLGYGRAAADIGPDDFESLSHRWPTTWGLKKRKRETAIVRAIFNYGYKKEKIDRLRFGAFTAPSRDELDAEAFAKQREHGKKVFTAEQLRAILDAAPPDLLPCILLGINCAFGPNDLATLPISYLDLDNSTHDYPRPKTTVSRRAFLWPETVDALKSYRRPEARDPAHAGLFFLTANGYPLVHETHNRDKEGNPSLTVTNAISVAFKKLLKKLNLYRPNLSFYSLRHCAETYGGVDQVAVDVVMGHKSPGMSETYRHGIDDDRLRAVADNLHRWLFGAPPSGPGKRTRPRLAVVG
jgi:integrase